MRRQPQNKLGHTCLPKVEFEPTAPVFDHSEILRALRLGRNYDLPSKTVRIFRSLWGKNLKLTVFSVFIIIGGAVLSP
jgi:hypothetical protein